MKLVHNICDQLHVKPRVHKNERLELTPIEAHTLFKIEGGKFRLRSQILELHALIQAIHSSLRTLTETESWQ